MDSNLVLHLGQEALKTGLLIAAPVLVVALLVGLIQAVTSIRDMTLGMILKIIGVGVTVLMFGGWMMQVAVRFTSGILNHVQTLGH